MNKLLLIFLLTICGCASTTYPDDIAPTHTNRSLKFNINKSMQSTVHIDFMLFREVGGERLLRMGKSSGLLSFAGDKVYVWTAAHTMRLTGEWRPLSDPKITMIHRDGKNILGTSIKLRTVFINMDYDVALLEAINITSRDMRAMGKRSTEFSSISRGEAAASEVYHVGNFFGHLRSSISKGIISNPYRLWKAGDQDTYRMQVDIFAAPGSSGGGIFLNDTGECAGMVVSTHKSTFNIAYVIPVSVLRELAIRHGFLEALTY